MKVEKAGLVAMLLEVGEENGRVLFTDLQQHGDQAGLLDLHDARYTGRRIDSSIPLSRMTVRLCSGV